MDAETFLANFEAVADAPGGVQRLRDLILDLGVRGRLVEQDCTDVPAGAGLTVVREEKGDTLASSIRGGAATPRIPEPDECPDQLPDGWAWARVDDTGGYVNGLAFKNSDWKSSGIPIIRIQNLTNPDAPYNFADGPFPEDRMAHDGDILVSWSATLNAFRWNRGPGVVNQHIFKVIPDLRVVRAEFLYHLIRHSIQQMAESEAAHGLVMKHINRGPFLSFVVGIPPLAEQDRIVTKADELLGLCDHLEQSIVRRSRTQEALAVGLTRTG
jgi:type I restriction enzyme, S subunit